MLQYFDQWVMLKPYFALFLRKRKTNVSIGMKRGTIGQQGTTLPPIKSKRFKDISYITYIISYITLPWVWWGFFHSFCLICWSGIIYNIYWTFHVTWTIRTTARYWYAGQSMPKHTPSWFRGPGHCVQYRLKDHLVRVQNTLRVVFVFVLDDASNNKVLELWEIEKSEILS